MNVIVSGFDHRANIFGDTFDISLRKIINKIESLVSGSSLDDVLSCNLRDISSSGNDLVFSYMLRSTVDACYNIDGKVLT